MKQAKSAHEEASGVKLAESALEEAKRHAGKYTQLKWPRYMLCMRRGSELESFKSLCGQKSATDCLRYYTYPNRDPLFQDPLSLLLTLLAVASLLDRVKLHMPWLQVYHSSSFSDKSSMITPTPPPLPPPPLPPILHFTVDLSHSRV